jgi:hypothetical protein
MLFPPFPLVPHPIDVVTLFIELKNEFVASGSYFDNVLFCRLSSGVETKIFYKVPSLDRSTPLLL